ncbi:hypothetical protein SLEP1_g20414 [Rubroshorea leprosula]|uniref:Uncharacterized protein n=1 Tax=Rubroshorea leprosula TaxID=152421 RepID=A0AAV5JBT1_9ROSI|nr:hypothetical protein SLEP1_g20414 [Rubroshorea leprosula]
MGNPHLGVIPYPDQDEAIGLELSNRPFLWVVRADVTKGKDEAYPERFQNRVADRGKMAGWAPQRAVLGHPTGF